MKKDILLVILGLVCIGLLVAVVGVGEKTKKMNNSLEEERYGRMVAEESLQKNAAKLATLEAQLKTANDKLGRIQELIGKEKNVNENLQKQYDELNKAKADLESKLKTTLEEKSALPVASTDMANSTAPTSQ